MTKIMFAGDTHANSDHVQYLLAQAKKQEADVIYQVGDWGISYGGGRQWEGFQKLIRRGGIPFVFNEGNHDNYTWLKEMGAFDAPDLFSLAPGISYAPRGCVWDWDGITFMSMGGGYSIDEDGRTEGLDWWPDEAIRDEDLASAFRKGKVDVLLSHDSPNNPTLQQYLDEHSVLIRQYGWDSYKLDAKSRQNRQQMDLVYQSCQARVVIHGHYHHYYRYINDHTGQNIFGLNRDTKGNESWMVIDTEHFNHQGW